MTDTLLTEGSKVFIALMENVIPLALVMVITVSITNVFLNMVKGKTRI